MIVFGNRVPGTTPYQLFSTWHLYGESDRRWSVPINIEHFRQQCRQAYSLNIRFAVFGFDPWPLDLRTAADREVEATLDQLLRITSLAQEEAPFIEWAWHGAFPLPTVHAERATPEWRKANLRLMRTRNDKGRFVGIDPWSQCDVVCPAMYCFQEQEGFDHWQEAYQHDLEMARNGGKVVRPFVSPYFFDAGQCCTDKLIPLDWWVSMFHWFHKEKLQPVVQLQEWQRNIIRGNEAWVETIRTWTGKW